MELNKEVLDCMQALRRRLREELTLDIRLSQADAIIALFEGSLLSHHEETRRLGRRLAELAEVPQPPTRKPLLTVEATPQIPARSVRIYRGQRVYA